MFDNEAKVQGQYIGAAQGYTGLPLSAALRGGDDCARAARSSTIGEEIDSTINRLEGQLESLRLVKTKLTNGGALSISISELSKALNRY